MSIINVLLNILWILFGGLLSAICWLLAGVLCCITVVGIPVGLQCFKFAKLILMPFGKKVYFGNMSSGSVLLNVIWILLGGLGLCISSIAMGVGSCLTIIGIPFGLQHRTGVDAFWRGNPSYGGLKAVSESFIKFFKNKKAEILNDFSFLFAYFLFFAFWD